MTRLISTVFALMLCMTLLAPTGCDYDDSSDGPTGYIMVIPNEIELPVGGGTTVEATATVAGRDLSQESGWKWTWVEDGTGGEIELTWGETLTWRGAGKDTYTASTTIKATKAGSTTLRLSQPADQPQIGWKVRGGDSEQCVIVIPD